MVNESMAVAEKIVKETESGSEQNIGLLRSRYRILLSKPLAWLNSGENHAYAVEDLRDPGNNLYAIVVASGMPHREDLAQSLTSKSTPGLIELY